MRRRSASTRRPRPRATLFEKSLVVRDRLTTPSDYAAGAPPGAGAGAAFTLSSHAATPACMTFWYGIVKMIPMKQTTNPNSPMMLATQISAPATTLLLTLFCASRQTPDTFIPPAKP